MRSARKAAPAHRICVRWAATACLAFTTAIGQAGPPALPTVAMAGIVVKPGVSDQTIGGAVEDLLFLALQERGIPVLERQRLGFVISERDLLNALSTKNFDMLRHPLPHVRYLVRGSLAVQPSGEFLLHTVLIDVGTGMEEAAGEEQGRYPDGLAAAVTKLADRLVQSAGKIVQTGSSRKPPFGFTRIPEVALTYFRGVECVLAGRPDLGVAWFREALHEDNEFLTARLWTSRAYDLLGLPDIADAGRHGVRATPFGARLMNLLDAGGAGRTGLATVAYMPETGLGTNASSSLFAALRDCPSFRLFDPTAINALASEADLDLSGWMDPTTPLLGFGWYAADAILQIRSSANDREAELLLLDAASGACLLKEKIDLTHGKSIHHVVQHVADALSPKNRKAAVASHVYAVPYPTDVVATKVAQDPREQAVQAFAAKVKRAADNPRDATALMDLADVYGEDHRVDMLLRGYSGEYRPALLRRAMDCITDKDSDLLLRLANSFSRSSSNQAPLFDRALAAIDPSQPDAMVRYLRIFRSFDNARRNKTIIDDPALFARACAINLECKMEIYGAGLDFYCRDNDCTNAFRCFETVAKSIQLTYGDSMDRFRKDQENRKDIKYLREHFAINSSTAPGYMTNDCDSFFKTEANIYYMAALMALKIGKDKTALNFLELARPLVNEIANRHLWLGVAERTYNQKWERIYMEVDALDAELRRRAGGAIKTETVFNAIVTAVVAVAHSPTGMLLKADAGTPLQRWFQAKYDVINRGLLACRQRSPLPESACDEFLGALNWSAARALRANDWTNLFAVAEEVAPSFDWSQQVRLWAAIGEYDRAQRILDARCNLGASKQDTAEDRGRALRMKADWIRAREGYEAWIRFLDAHTNLFALDARISARIEAGYYAAALELLPPATNYHRASLLILAGRENEAAESLKSLRALRLLDRLRILKTLYAPPGTRQHDGSFMGLVPIAHRDWSPMEAQVRLVMMGRPDDDGRCSWTLQDFKSCFKEYGQECVPAFMTFCMHGATWDQIAISCQYFKQTFDATHAREIVDAFRAQPELAPIALHIAPHESAPIYRAHIGWKLTEDQPFLVRYGGESEAIVRNRIVELYDVLFVYCRELSANFHTVLGELDKNVETNTPPEIVEAFRETLDAMVEAMSRKRFSFWMPETCRIAVRHGAAAGILGLLQCFDPVAESVRYLRGYIDLPPDDTEAIRMLKENGGRWTWNPARKKYDAGASPRLP